MTTTSTAKTARNSRFQAGSGLYTCRCCKRATRDTGRGDNEQVRLCAQCYDLAGEENHFSDTGGEFYDGAAEVLRLIAEVADKGGNVSCWDDLKAKALAAMKPVKPPVDVDAVRANLAVAFGAFIANASAANYANMEATMLAYQEATQA